MRLIVAGEAANPVRSLTSDLQRFCGFSSHWNAGRRAGHKLSKHSISPSRLIAAAQLLVHFLNITNL